MPNRSYSRPFYDTNGCYTKIFEGVADNLSNQQFAIFLAKLAAERDEMALKREAFLLGRAKRIEELGSRSGPPEVWQNPDENRD